LIHTCFSGILKYPIYAAISFFLKNPTDGAQTTIECAVSEKVEKDTGKYYSDCKEKNPKLQAKDDVMARKLWDFSVKAVKLEE
jgi:retinol dehydrogenase-12